MLDYLLPANRAKRRLLELLWSENEKGSVSELARMAGVSFRAAHKELDAMHKAGMVSRSNLGNATVFEAFAGHPMSGALRDLFRSGRNAERTPLCASPEHDEVRSWLAAWGAPRAGASATASPPPLEKVLARAARLAHRDASVARSLPVCLWRHRSRLDFERLWTEAQRTGEKQTLGFLLELAGTLGGDPDLRAAARRFRDRRVRREQDFFDAARSTLERRLARERTPRVAKKWHFLMNMSLETFASTFDKFRADAEVPGR